MWRRGNRTVIYGLGSPQGRGGESTQYQGIAMSIVQKMRGQLAEAMKARDTVRLGFLRYWIAQLTLGTGAEMSEADALKKMRGVLKEAKSGPTTFTAPELALLSEWIPAPLTADQINDALAPVAEQIKAAPK